MAMIRRPKDRDGDGEGEGVTPLKLRGIETSHGVTWIRGQLLGRGAFGSVYTAICRFPPDNSDPPELAAKSVELSQARSLRCEMNILRDHLNSSFFVVRCYGDEYTQAENGKVFYNVMMEKCAEGSLKNRVLNSGGGGVGLPEVEVRLLTHDILQGLAYIHSNGYIHCDIKPDNILLVPSSNKLYSVRAKIGDFGCAVKVEDPYAERGLSGFIGTRAYMPPEFLQSYILSGFADIWALGCVIIEMMTGKTDRIYVHPEIPSDITKNGRDFLEKCLNKDARKRWTASMLLEHPFIPEG